MNDDIGVDAVKIGMLGTAATIEAVATALQLLRPGTPVVLDPVMVSESGAELLEPAARERAHGRIGKLYRYLEISQRADGSWHDERFGDVFCQFFVRIQRQAGPAGLEEDDPARAVPRRGETEPVAIER